MTVDLEKWKDELRIHKNSKHLVHWGVKRGESIFSQCFKRILDTNRKCIPIMFTTKIRTFSQPR